MPSASSRHTARRPSTSASYLPIADHHAARAIRQREHAVVGRALAVDGDRVERRVARFDQRALQHGRFDLRVARQEPQHGRQHRLDHAGALGHAADGEGLAGAGVDLDGVFLRERIGRHDGPRRFRVRVAQRIGRRDDAVGDLARIERHADYARGRDHHFLDFAAERARHFDGHHLRDAQAGVAGAGVGAAAVDDHRARAALRLGEVLARDDHGRRHGLVRGEHGRGAGDVIRRDESEIELAVRLDAAGDARGAESLGSGNTPIHRHDHWTRPVPSTRSSSTRPSSRRWS